MDGDGIDNTMYKVTINNSSWSAHDLLFGAADITTVSSTTLESELTIQSDRIVVNSRISVLSLYDITGKLIWRKNSVDAGEVISLQKLNSGIYLLNVNGVSTYKLGVR